MDRISDADMYRLLDIKKCIDNTKKRDLIEICTRYNITYYKSWANVRIRASILQFINTVFQLQIKHRRQPKPMLPPMPRHATKPRISTMKIDTWVRTPTCAINPNWVKSNTFDIFNQMKPDALNDLIAKCISIRKYCAYMDNKMINLHIYNMFMYDYLSSTYSVGVKHDALHNLIDKSVNVIFRSGYSEENITLAQSIIIVPFQFDLIIIVTNISKWHLNTDTIQAGIYILTKYACNDLMELTEWQFQIKDVCVYNLLQIAITDNTYIPWTYVEVSTPQIDFTKIF